MGRGAPVVDNRLRKSGLRNQLDRGYNQEGGLETKGSMGGRETDSSAAYNREGVGGYPQCFVPFVDSVQGPQLARVLGRS